MQIVRECIMSDEHRIRRWFAKRPNARLAVAKFDGEISMRRKR